MKAHKLFWPVVLLLSVLMAARGVYLLLWVGWLSATPAAATHAHTVGDTQCWGWMLIALALLPLPARWLWRTHTGVGSDETA